MAKKQGLTTKEKTQEVQSFIDYSRALSDLHKRFPQYGNRLKQSLAEKYAIGVLRSFFKCANNVYRDLAAKEDRQSVERAINSVLAKKLNLSVLGKNDFQRLDDLFDTEVSYSPERDGFNFRFDIYSEHYAFISRPEMLKMLDKQALESCLADFKAAVIETLPKKRACDIEL